MAGSEASPDVRPAVRESWRRSAAAIPSSISQAPFIEDGPARWRDGRVSRAFEVVREDLDRAASDGDFVAGATDADGTVVWTAGDRATRRRAELLAFLPGGRWDENSVGTNAIALALHDRRPSAVWAAEHYAPMVQDWVGYGAPVIDPITGSTVATLGIGTRWTDATPLALPTVGALARLMEAALAADRTQSGAARIGELGLRTLGTSEVVLDGVPILLSPRQVELLVVLSLAPEGLTLEQLHEEVHRERPVSPTTTKAELSHLRRQVGPVIASRPYRLASPVWADHLEVQRALEAGRVDDALHLYRGPMLPRSTAPAVEEQRHALEVALREAVLARGESDQLLQLSSVMPYDVYVHERALSALEPDDVRRGPVEGRLALLE